MKELPTRSRWLPRPCGKREDVDKSSRRAVSTAPAARTKTRAVMAFSWRSAPAQIALITRPAPSVSSRSTVVSDMMRAEPVASAGKACVRSAVALALVGHTAHVLHAVQRGRPPYATEFRAWGIDARAMPIRRAPSARS
jgi:hypothetical protein